MRTHAAVATEPGHPLTVTELELDELRPDEVRVRMVAAGVCHTDAAVRDGVLPTPLPAVLGHEGAGVVEEVGSAVATVRPGDHVLLGPNSCGSCRNCLSGQPMYCEELGARCFGGSRPDGTKAFSRDGEAVSSHFFGQSSFAAWSNVTERSIVKVDPALPLEILAPLGCGLQTGAGAVLHEMRPAAGSSIAVFGAGAVGAGAIMAARVAGCTTIVAVDLHESRREAALRLGATHAVDGRAADVPARLLELTGGRGVDFVLDTTGVPQVLTGALEALAIRGTIVLVGAAAFGTTVPFEIGASLTKGWTFKTVIEGSSVPQVFIPRLIELWQQGRFPFDELVEAYPLARINEAFDDSASGRTVKPVVVF